MNITKMSYEYMKDNREAHKEWVLEKKTDRVWYADLTPIIKSFSEDDLLAVGSIVQCPFGRGKKKTL